MALPTLGAEAARPDLKQHGSHSSPAGAGLRYGGSPQTTRTAYRPVGSGLTKSEYKREPSRVLAPQNIGYDSITNAITTGNGDTNTPTIYISEGETVNFKGRYTAATDTWGNLLRTDSYVQIEDPSLHLLIQAGFPRVTGPGDYWRESTKSGGPVNASGEYNGVIQTVNLLQFGRQGLFQAPSGSKLNYQVGHLFIPQHAGFNSSRKIN